MSSNDNPAGTRTPEDNKRPRRLTSAEIDAALAAHGIGQEPVSPERVAEVEQMLDAYIDRTYGSVLKKHSK